MIHTKRWIVFPIIYFLFLHTHAQVNGQDLGEKFYQSGNYSQAIVYYEQLLQIQPHDGAILYNLAQTHEMQGNQLLAMSYQLRARQLQPRDEDIFNSLVRLGGVTDASPLAVVDFWGYVGWSVLTLFSLYELNNTAFLAWGIFCAVLLIHSLTHYFKLNQFSIKSILLLTIGIAISFITILYATAEYASTRYPIVIAQGNTTIYNAPDASYLAIDTLSSPMPLYSLETTNGWTKVIQSDGVTGWVKTSLLTPINPN